MGINRRISSTHARFVKNPDRVRAYLTKYSKEAPAIVGAEIYECIHNSPSLHDLRDRIKLNEREEVEPFVANVSKPTWETTVVAGQLFAMITDDLIFGQHFASVALNKGVIELEHETHGTFILKLTRKT